MLNFKNFKYQLFEKRIAQLISEIEIRYSFDVITTKHAIKRGEKRDLDKYDDRSVSNEEIVHLINMFKRKIAELIFHGGIKHNEDFIIKSDKYFLSLAIKPIYKDGMWWQLVIKTVFRESKKYTLRTGLNQLVLTDDDI
ncbi:MAG: hypothetical protein ACOC3Z_03575 [Nanoarchaeota archaeon]